MRLFNVFNKEPLSRNSLKKEPLSRRSLKETLFNKESSGRHAYSGRHMKDDVRASGGIRKSPGRHLDISQFPRWRWLFGSRSAYDKSTYSLDSYALFDLEHLIELRGLPQKKQNQAKFRTVQRLALVWTVLIAQVLLIAACFFSFVPVNARAYTGNTGSSSAVVMNFVGDVMLGRYVMATGELSGYDSLFSHVDDYWDAADLVFANLENAVLQDNVSTYDEADKDIHLWSSYEGLESAVEAGINVWGCANNHSADYGERAIQELTEYFQTEDIAYSGVGGSIEDAAQYTCIDLDGLTVAFISLADADICFETTLATDSQGGILSTAYEDYSQLVYEAAQEADVTVVYIHWGEENATSVNDSQTRLAHHLADAGADIIIGSHPHVLQDVELYGDSIIFYSLGNFLFDQGNTYARDSVMVEYTMEADGSGAFRLYTVRIDDGVPYVTTSWFYQQRINRTLTRSLSEDSYYLDDEGFIVIPFTVQTINTNQ